MIKPLELNKNMSKVSFTHWLLLLQMLHHFSYIGSLHLGFVPYKYLYSMNWTTLGNFVLLIFGSLRDFIQWSLTFFPCCCCCWMKSSTLTSLKDITFPACSHHFILWSCLAILGRYDCFSIFQNFQTYWQHYDILFITILTQTDMAGKESRVVHTILGYSLDTVVLTTFHLSNFCDSQVVLWDKEDKTRKRLHKKQQYLKFSKC